MNNKNLQIIRQSNNSKTRILPVTFEGLLKNSKNTEQLKASL